MNSTGNETAAEPRDSLSRNAEAQAQQSVDRAVAASDEAIRTALGGTANAGLTVGGQYTPDATAQADAQAPSQDGASASEAAVARAVRQAGDAQANAIEAAQRQAGAAQQAAERATSTNASDDQGAESGQG